MDKEFNKQAEEKMDKMLKKDAHPPAEPLQDVSAERSISEVGFIDLRNETPISKEELLKLGFEGNFDRQYKHIGDTLWTIYYENGRLHLDDYDWVSLDITQSVKSIPQLKLLISSLEYKSPATPVQQPIVEGNSGRKLK